jgi:hypothetical protein
MLQYALADQARRFVDIYDAGHRALKYDKKMLNCSEWKAGFTPPSDFLDNELNPQHKLPTGVGSFHFQGDAKW